MEPNLSKAEFLVEDGHANKLNAERAASADTLCRYLEEQAKAQVVLSFRGWPGSPAAREKMIRLELTRAKNDLADFVGLGIDRKTGRIEAQIFDFNDDDSKEGVLENIGDFFFVYRMEIENRSAA